MDENGRGKPNFFGHRGMITGRALTANGTIIASLSRATSGSPGLTMPSGPPESANRPIPYEPLFKKSIS
jgi:hypothetical protein